MLAFFPWLRLNSEIQVDRYALLPFERGRVPGGVQQSELDLILQPYLQSARTPVTRATLLQLSGKEITGDLTDEECNLLFWFADRVAFAGLAKREYFTDCDYWNQSNFTLVIQAFATPGAGMSITSRRRDGECINMKTHGACKISKPEHVPIFGSHHIDQQLLEALIGAETSVQCSHLADAVFFYNRANTDSDQVSRQMEIVMMMSAFERALNCGRVDENLIAQMFVQKWRRNGTVDFHACTRIPDDQRKGSSVSEVWIRDLFRCRNACSHGKRAPGHRPVWSLDEHLLLGAFALPLLVKCLLSDEGFYNLSDRDKNDIEAFEELVCAKLFEQIVQDGERVWLWQVIRSEQAWKGAARRTAHHLDREPTRRQTDEPR